MGDVLEASTASLASGVYWGRFTANELNLLHPNSVGEYTPSIPRSYSH